MTYCPWQFMLSLEKCNVESNRPVWDFKFKYSSIFFKLLKQGYEVWNCIMRIGWFQSSTVLRRLSLADHGHGHGRTLLTSYSIPSYTGPAALRESLPTKQGVASGLQHQHQGAHISGSGGAGSRLHSKLELQEWPSKLSTLDRNEWAQEQRWRGWTLCISGGQ